MSPSSTTREWALVRATSGSKHDAPCGSRCRWFYSDGRRRRHPRTEVYVQGPGRVQGRHSRCRSGRRPRSLSERGYSDGYNTVTSSETDVILEPENEANLANGEATASNDGHARHASPATDTTSGTAPHDAPEGETSNLHARGGGLGRLLRQCFGMRSPPSPMPQYIYHEHSRPPYRPRHVHRPRHQSRHQPRHRHRRRRRRHSSHHYSRPHHHRHDRYESPSDRPYSHPRRNKHHSRSTKAPKAPKAPNHDAMNDDELFDSLLAEERTTDPMLRDLDARRAQGGDM